MPRTTKQARLLEAFESKLGPAEKWAGNCYGIALGVVEHELVPAGSAAVYGHWVGPVHEKSMFAIGSPFTQHGWVAQPDGKVCDPTRWVFEHVAPYIYVGAPDYYDEGGNRWRMGMLGDPPPYDPTDKNQHELSLPANAALLVKHLLRQNDIERLSSRQVMWLANQAPNVMGPFAVHVYAALDRLGLAGLIPWDNQQMVARLANVRAPRARSRRKA